MFVSDAHCDTLYAIAIAHQSPDSCTVTRENLYLGQVGLQTFAMFAGPDGPQGTPYANARRMLSAIDQLPVPIARGKLPLEPPSDCLGILSCEGGEMFEGSIARFEELHSLTNFRMVALTWNHENEVGYPANGSINLGLKPFGRTLLREMDQRGVLADVSHLNESGFWDVCEHAVLPPIASHSNCRWLCDVPRNLSREQVRALIDRQGFIGINFYSGFLREDAPAHLEDVVRHIDTLCEMGAEHIVGFGSDFDGIDAWPAELSSPACFPVLLKALSALGYTQSQLENIAGLNLWRILKRAESVGRGGRS